MAVGAFSVICPGGVTLGPGPCTRCSPAAHRAPRTHHRRGEQGADGRGHPGEAGVGQPGLKTGKSGSRPLLSQPSEPLKTLLSGGA